MKVHRCLSSSIALACATILLVVSTTHAAEPADRITILTVVGAAGGSEYGGQFRDWADRWQSAAEQAGAESIRVGSDSEAEAPDKQRLQQLLREEIGESTAPIWLILIGHGTYDGRSAKFNLRGPDVSAAELAQWLEPLERPVVLVNCASSSGPFINKLSRQDRVVITAAKSGFEMNFARFGDHLSAAVIDPAADLDKDGQASLLEAFLLASSRVREFYEQESRLATEQALIDDNGDGRGTPATWFRGIHPVRRAKDGESLDGARAHQFVLVPNEAERSMPAEVRQRREELEQRVAELRQNKPNLDEDAYYAKLEPMLTEIARLYQRLENRD
jgi:hypothetical protein